MRKENQEEWNEKKKENNDFTSSSHQFNCPITKRYVHHVIISNLTREDLGRWSAMKQNERFCSWILSIPGRNLWISLSRIVLILVLVLVIFENPRWRQQVAKVSLNITNFDGVVWSLNFRLAIHELFSTAMTLEYFGVKATIWVI